MTLSPDMATNLLPLLQAFAEEEMKFVETVTGLPAVMLVFCAVLALLPWRYWGRIWAVARLTVLHALRMKVAIVLVLFILALVAALPFVLRHDDTPYGRIRMVVTYTIYMAQFLLCVLTLFLATATLCSEFTGKQIYILDTKPVPRWCVLAGKWLGVMIINAGLLLCVGAILYGVVRYQARMPEIGRMEVTERTPPHVANIVERVRRGNAELQARVLHAREMRVPRMEDGRPYTALVRQRAADELAELRKEGQLPQERSEEWMFDTLARRINNEIFKVDPGSHQQWRIGGLPRDLGAGQYVTLRFTMRGVPRPLRNEIVGIWQMGRYDPDQQTFTGDRFFSHNPYDPPAWICDRPHDITVPAGLIDPETGVLTVRFVNLTRGQNAAAVFPAADGVQLFVPVGGVEVNLLRGLALVFAKLAYLAVLGLLCASFLSFPVASFTAFSGFIITLAGGFLQELTGKVYLFGTGLVRPGTPMEEGDVYIQGLLRALLWLFPDLSSFDPVPFLADGRAVPWGLVAQSGFMLVAVYGVCLALIGGFIYHRREVAAVD